MTLSAATARAIKPGQVIRDDVVRGLQLHGRQSGGAWLYWYVAADGKERRPKLGAFPALGIEAAREVARQWAKRVAMGLDPSHDRQALRDAPTMDELFVQYVAFAETYKKARSVDEDRRNWRLHCAPRIGSTRAAAITAADCEALLSAVATVRHRARENARDARAAPIRVGGATAANRVRALLSGVLSYAERSTVGIRPRGSNPIAETTKRPERRRRRHVTADEFGRLFRELDRLAERYPRHVAALWCSLYCGTRVGELLTARREWMAGDGLLLLPEHKTQRITGEPRRVQIPRQALEIIRAIPSDRSGRLFGAGLDRWAIGKVWRRATKAAGCVDLQPRDLRRTFASVAKTHAGATLDQIGDLLGHGMGDPTVTAGYAYLFDDAASATAQRTADAIDALAGKAAGRAPLGLARRRTIKPTRSPG